MGLGNTSRTTVETLKLTVSKIGRIFQENCECALLVNSSLPDGEQNTSFLTAITSWLRKKLEERFKRTVSVHYWQIVAIIKFWRV